MLQLRAEAAARGVFDLEVAAHELETSAAAEPSGALLPDVLAVLNTAGIGVMSALSHSQGVK